MNGAPSSPARHPLSPLLGWAAVSGVVAWGAWVLWNTGMLARLTAGDPSRVSWAILAIYVATQGYAGWLALTLHRDGRRLADRSALVDDADDHPLVAYVARRRRGDAGDEEGHAYLHSLLHDRLSSGWFVADLMFKLGLIGTVIGFIVMLGAITDLTSMDVNQAQRMLGDMSGGMRLALYTTLTGLGCGALTGLQFHLLERSAETLVRRVSAMLDAGRG